MELIDIIRNRRSIRKYTAERVEKEKLDAIVEAGLFAPNPGGRQGTKIILLDDPAMIEKIGIVNANCENRNWDAGVSAEQPVLLWKASREVLLLHDNGNIRLLPSHCRV